MSVRCTQTIGKLSIPFSVTVLFGLHLLTTPGLGQNGPQNIAPRYLDSRIYPVLKPLVYDLVVCR